MTTNILPGIERIRLPYQEYRDESAMDCDILLWEPTTWYGRIIAAATEGPFCHASAVVSWEKRVWQVGYEEGRNGYGSPLSGEVQRHPGKISVFRVDLLGGDADNVRSHLIDDLSGQYEGRSLCVLAFGHCLGVRWLKNWRWYRRLIERASQETASAHCAKHIARAFALGAEVRFVHKALSEISPNDIGRSGLVRYLGTLE